MSWVTCFGFLVPCFGLAIWLFCYLSIQVFGYLNFVCFLSFALCVYSFLRDLTGFVLAAMRDR